MENDRNERTRHSPGAQELTLSGVRRQKRQMAGVPGTGTRQPWGQREKPELPRGQGRKEWSLSLEKDEGTGLTCGKNA